MLVRVNMDLNLLHACKRQHHRDEFCIYASSKGCNMQLVHGHHVKRLAALFAENRYKFGSETFES